MGYENCGSNPNSKAALNKGMNVSSKMSADSETQRCVNEFLNQPVEHRGETMTYREAIIWVQIEKALKEKDLRSAQWLFDIASRSEQTTTGANINTATLSPLEALQAKMLSRTVDDRRKKAD